MKTLTITGQYASSNEIITGSKRLVLLELRYKALKMRKDSRATIKLFKNVHSLPKNTHQSELVNMASYDLNKLGIDQLLPLMNAHGVLKFNVN